MKKEYGVLFGSIEPIDEPPLVMMSAAEILDDHNDSMQFPPSYFSFAISRSFLEFLLVGVVILPLASPLSFIYSDILLSLSLSSYDHH